jgi:hypothetical protein
MRHKKALGALLLLTLTLLGAAGCARAQAQSPETPALLGSWFENESGGEYQFVGDNVLVLPKTQATGGNAVTYRVLDGDKLEVVSGQSHYVSEITTLTTSTLVLSDPVTGANQKLLRSLARTRHLKSIEATAAIKVTRLATMTVDPNILWVAEKPVGKGSQWTSWSPKTLDTYRAAWVWTTVKRDRTPPQTSGGGDTRGYSFGFKRKVPASAQILAFNEEASVEATKGFEYLDVGYSASKAQYPAGTMVYLPTGLIYSLGDGYAIAIGLDRRGQSFVPVTRK